MGQKQAAQADACAKKRRHKRMLAPTGVGGEHKRMLAPKEHNKRHKADACAKRAQQAAQADACAKARQIILVGFFYY
jgi:hypothetical protein